MLVQFYSPMKGGAEVMFYQLAHGLAMRGHEIHVIKHKVPNSGEKDVDVDESSKVFIHNIFPFVKHKGGLPATMLQNLFYVLNAIRYGVKIIRKESIDLIHANVWSPIFAGLILSKITRRPLLVTIHDIELNHGISFLRKWMKQFGGLSTLKALIGYIFELLAIKLSKNIHTVSEASKEDILRIGFKDKRFHIIPNCLDLRFYPDNNVIEYRDEIVFVGRLVFYKNLKIVLEALPLIPNRNVKLMVIGDGPMKTYWQKLAEGLGIKDRVEFKGFIPHKEKIDILKRASALVLPSLLEGFGIVILEAWAYKKPVIVANLPPLNQIVEHGKDGFVVNPFKPEEWAKYISLLIDDKEQAEKIGLNGYNKLIERYNVANWITKFERLYEKLIVEEI